MGYDCGNVVRVNNPELSGLDLRLFYVFYYWKGRMGSSLLKKSNISAIKGINIASEKSKEKNG